MAFKTRSPPVKDHRTADVVSPSRARRSTTISLNEASESGGGLYAAASVATIDGSVSDNRAAFGAGVYATDGASLLLRAPLDRNAATAAGGGAYLEDGAACATSAGGREPNFAGAFLFNARGAARAGA